MDAPVPGRHTLHFSAAAAYRVECRHSFPSNVRTVRLLLQFSSLRHVYLAGQAIRLRADAGRRREAALHYGRSYSVCYSDPTGAHLNAKVDWGAGRETL